MSKGIISFLENKKFEYIFLVVVTLFGAFLRFYKLGEWSFWVEEVHTIRHTSAIDSLGSVFANLRNIYYILNKPVILILGESEWSARLLPVLLGLLAIPLLYWAVKKIFGIPVAVLATILMVISPWHIYWSQNARFYTFLLLLFSLSLFLYYYGIETDRIRYFVFSFAALVLAVMTHLLASFLLPIFAVYFLLLKILPFNKPAGLRIRNLLPFLLLPVLGYILYESYLIFYLNDGPLYLNVYNRYFASTRVFLGYGNPFTMLTSVVYYIGTPLALLSIFGSGFLLKQKNRAGLMISLGAFLPLLTMMVMSPFSSVVNRYVFMTLPFWIILASFAFLALVESRNIVLWLLYLGGVLLLLLRDPVIKDLKHYIGMQNYGVLYLIVPVSLVIFFLVLLVLRGKEDPGQLRYLIWIPLVLVLIIIHPIVTDTMYFYYQHGHRDNWKAAASIIKKEKYEGERIFSAITPVLSYYIGEQVEEVVDIDVITENTDDQRFWLVEEFGLNQRFQNTYSSWVEDNCALKGRWDQYTIGQNWKMRVYLCES